jgi:hypothetical protein
MVVNPHLPASREIDVEATAELPIVDSAALSEDGIDASVALATPAGLPELAESLREVESRLTRKTGRLRELEEQLAAAASVQQQLRHELDEARRSGAAQAADLRHQARDLEELRRCVEFQGEALRHAQGLRGVLEGMLAGHDAVVADIEARHAAELAARDELAANQKREAIEREARLKSESESTLEAMKLRTEEVAQLRQQQDGSARSAIGMIQEAEALRAMISQQQEELAELRANDEAACAGIAIFEQQRQRIRTLEGELAVAQEWANQQEQDHTQAKERILDLESEARASVAMLENLQHDIARLSQDSGAQPTLRLVGTDPLPERYLESDGDGTAAVHRLGRRTTIGRTPDNDIQIVAGFISRNHALVLGTDQDCTIEDLNSTNGVTVNGRRVTRQVLHDGDTVTIGQARFRYRQAT